MEEVIIKAVNEQYVVKCNMQRTEDFLLTLTQKLLVCAASKQGHFEAFFDIDITLSDQTLMALFDVCKQCHTTILGFLHTKKEQAIQIYHEPIYSGQKYFFNGPTLIVGNIPRDTFISSYDSLYVIGEVAGNIDLLHPHATISASHFTCCFIRICDSIYQNVTNSAPARVYYNRQTLTCRELKEEVVWDSH